MLNPRTLAYARKHVVLICNEYESEAFSAWHATAVAYTSPQADRSSEIVRATITVIRYPQKRQLATLATEIMILNSCNLDNSHDMSFEGNKANHVFQKGDKFCENPPLLTMLALHKLETFISTKGSHCVGSDALARRLSAFTEVHMRKYFEVLEPT